MTLTLQELLSGTSLESLKTPEPCGNDSSESLKTDKTASESETTPETPTILPTYNPNSRCVKCRGTAIATKYEATREVVAPGRFIEIERQERTCERCGYIWQEGIAHA